MRNTMLVGILLLILGAIAFAYQGITYTTQKHVADIGPIHATKSEQKTIPIPPIIGVVAMVGGLAVILADRRNG